MKSTFDKSYTVNMKGIAVLILLFHHLTYAGMPIPIREFNIHYILSCTTKVCVAIFTILSGYGLTKSYEKTTDSNGTFVWKHIKKLLINYWWVYIPALILAFLFQLQGDLINLYGGRIKGIGNLLLDFLGIHALFGTPTLNGTWWYIEGVMTYYLLFPLLHKLSKKAPMTLLVITSLPCWFIEFIPFSGSTNREIFYLLPFVVGILLAERGTMDRLVDYTQKNTSKVIIISFISTFVMAACATQSKMIANVLYAIAIICLGIGIKNVKFSTGNIMEFLGRHSMNIFLVHSFICYHYIVPANLLRRIPLVSIRYLCLLLVSLAISIVIENVKKFIKPYTKPSSKIEKQKKIKLYPLGKRKEHSAVK